jgi:hypothetical protein
MVRIYTNFCDEIKAYASRTLASFVPKPPKHIKQSCKVPGIIQQYCNILEKRIALVAPTTDLIGKSGTTQPTKPNPLILG